MLASELLVMKRAAFELEELQGNARFEDWVGPILGKRRGEAPYELLCAWRRIFAVPANIPYANMRIVEDNAKGFYLQDTASEDVLMYARVDQESKRAMVTAYHATAGRAPYKEWCYRDRWPWTARCSFTGHVPEDVWGRLKDVALPSECVRLARMPLSKRWMRMWHERLNIEAYCAQLIQPIENNWTFLTLLPSRLLALRRVMSLLWCILARSAIAPATEDSMMAFIFIQWTGKTDTIRVRRSQDNGMVYVKKEEHELHVFSDYEMTFRYRGNCVGKTKSQQWLLDFLLGAVSV